VLRRLGYAFGVFAAVLVLGTLGYVVLEGWGLFESLYMTVITMGGVGFREVHPLTARGQLWTMLVIVAGVGALGFAVVTVTDFMVEGHFSGLLEGRRMEKRIAGMSGHHVIAGVGRVGSVVAEEFAMQDAPFVVIDHDDAALSRARESGWAYILGDATEEAVLLSAGIERARSLTAALDGDAENLFVTLTGKGMNPGLFAVARATARSAESKLRRAGADRVITPTEIGGRRLAAMVMRPGIADYPDVVTGRGGVELKLEQIELGDSDPFAGLTVGAADIRSTTGAYLLALYGKSGTEVTHPTADTVMRAGDRLVLLGTDEQMRAFAGRACTAPGVCYPDTRS
jgi:voltage-gated potassium channel